MPTLHVESVPKVLYKTLRQRAKGHHRSVSAEVLSLLDANVPTEKELRAREEAYRRLIGLRFTKIASGNLPNSTDLIRQDRER